MVRNSDVWLIGSDYLGYRATLRRINALKSEIKLFYRAEKISLYVVW